MLRRFIAIVVLMAIACNSFLSYDLFAQTPSLSLPGQMASVSTARRSCVLRGLKLDPKNPLNIQFLIEPGASGVVDEADAAILVNYFLAALTIPKENLWVNLSPLEKDRILPQALSQTELGVDMLDQDYLLKQLSASLTYPETASGKAYWSSNLNRQSALAKVWIKPGDAQVYEGKDMVLITKASLRAQSKDVSFSALLPLIENNINSSEDFAPLRQIYNAVILGLWFKDKFKESFYKNYFNKSTVAGIDSASPKGKEEIYGLYLDAIKSGAYKVIKNQNFGYKNVKRTYFCGGILMTPQVTTASSPGGLSGRKVSAASVDIVPNGSSALAHDSYKQATLDGKIRQMFEAVAGCSYEPKLLKAFDAVRDLAKNDRDLYVLVDYFIALYNSSNTVGPRDAVAFAESSMFDGEGKIFGRYIMTHIVARGKFTSIDELEKFVDEKAAYVKSDDSFARNDSVVIKRGRAAISDARRAVGKIVERNKVYMSDMQEDLKEYGRKPLSKEQMERAMYAHHNLSKGWRPLTLAEGLIFAKKDKWPQVNGNYRPPKRVFTSEWAVTLCSDDDIRTIYGYLEKDGLFTHEDAKWLMDRGWLGPRFLAFVGAVALTALSLDADAARRHSRHKHAVRHGKPHAANVEKPRPVRVTTPVAAPRIDDYKRKEFAPAEDKPSANNPTIDRAGSSSKSNTGVIVGAGIAAAALAAGVALSRRSRKKEEDGFGELSRELEKVEIQCSKNKDANLKEMVEDLRHLKWFAIYWKKHRLSEFFTEKPLTYPQLMAILAAHKMPGGYRVLDGARSQVDPNAATEHMVIAKDGRRLVTTGSASQNDAKYLSMENARVGLTPDQIKWIMREGGAGKAQDGVGGVEFESAFAGKAAGSSGFYFENIPDIGEIGSMGFEIRDIFFLRLP